MEKIHFNSSKILYTRGHQSRSLATSGDIEIKPLFYHYDMIVTMKYITLMLLIHKKRPPGSGDAS